MAGAAPADRESSAIRQHVSKGVSFVVHEHARYKRPARGITRVPRHRVAVEMERGRGRVFFKGTISAVVRVHGSGDSTDSLPSPRHAQSGQVN